MRTIRIGIVWLLMASVGAPAMAQTSVGTRQSSDANRASVSLRESVAKAAVDQEQTKSQGDSMPRGYLWAGTSLFVGGMAVGLYAFLNNKNGKFPEFGEAEATNKPLGSAGLAAAFAGGTLLFLGSRRGSAAASVTIAPDGVRVTKKLTW